MPNGEVPFLPSEPVSEKDAQCLETILSALQTLSVAVAALPGSQLQIGNLQTGPGAMLSVSPEKGLAIQYKPGETGPVERSGPTELQQTVGAEPVSQPSPTSSAETATKKETERVTLTGRLAFEPNFKTANGGKLQGRLGMAVPDETKEKKVRYEQIYTTGEYARKVQEANLHKGQTVQVVGYEQMRPGRDKDGAEKVVKQIYAVAIKPIGNKSPKNK